MFDLSKNYFQLFDLSPQFEIDQAVLDQHYRAIQHQVHPDRFAGKSDQDQRLAVQYTSFVNEAYQCLKRPLERAKYLLVLKRVELNLDARRSDGRPHVDSEFLMTQIELREQLEALTAQAKPEAGIKQLLAQLSEKIEALSRAFSAAYNQGDNTQALDVVVKWQFLVKLQRDVEVLEESLL